MTNYASPVECDSWFWQDLTGDLYEHFMEMGLEIHMFASQWFLTLFTAKFPLFLVFHILDLFLCEVIACSFIKKNMIGVLCFDD